ncbi:MAG: hypothetical protein U0271_08045 [Polyangiaceae bacterium]
MPRVSVVEQRPDYDRIIELGEAERATRGADRYVSLPLAAAYHARGCASLSRAALDSAERDVARALELDPWARYLVTRGSLCEARGDLTGALRDYDSAVAAARPPPPTPDEVERIHEGLLVEWERYGGDALEGARALYARGVTRARRGDLVGARDDLREAKAALACVSRDPRGELPDLRERLERSIAALARHQPFAKLT